MITIYINNTPTSLPENTAISDLAVMVKDCSDLIPAGLEKNMLFLLNGQPVSPLASGERLLQEGDRLMVLSILSGG